MKLFNFKTSASLLCLTISSFITLSVLLNNTVNPSPLFVNVTFALMGFLMSLSVLYMGSMITAKWFEDQENLEENHSIPSLPIEKKENVIAEQFA